MSFEFQSTLVNVTPNFRISGANIGGLRILQNGDIKVARLVVTNDRDIQFALSGPYEAGDPDAIYAALSSDLYELVPGILVNEGAISSIEMTSTEIVIDLEGSDLKYAFESDATATGPVELNSHSYKLSPAGFAALGTAAAIWRSSMDGTLEGLATTIATETADRIAADSAIQADVDQNEADADAAMAAEIARVDALIASGMWLYADQAAFPPAADNHGRVVHSHADGAIFYAHGGMWHQVAKEVDLQTTIDSVANEATARVAGDDALSARLDTLEADPTTATAVAAGDAATLSSANSYTDTAVSNVIGSAPGVLDTLGEIADAINDDANVYTTLVSQISAVQSDVDGNEADSDAAEAALSGRLDTLEADPTTATAVAAVQADVDQNESDSDAADAALSARLDVLEADPTTATAVAAVQSDVDQNEADADAALAGEATTRGNADTALSGRLDVLEADPTTATAVAAVQSDVDQNEADSDAADAALSGRLDVLEADPTTQSLLSAETAARLAGDTASNTYTDTQIANLIGAAPGVLNTLEEIANSINDDADVYTNIVSQIVAGDTSEATARAAADTTLSDRLDVLETDPTTATAVAAVQSDVDQNEADADAALALKAPLADPDFTGLLEVDTNARLEFASNLTKLHNVLRGTSIVIGNNITLNPAAADGRVEIEGEFYLRPSDLTNAADDAAAAAAGVIVGQVYRNGSQLMIRVS